MGYVDGMHPGRKLSDRSTWAPARSLPLAGRMFRTSRLLCRSRRTSSAMKKYNMPSGHLLLLGTGAMGLARYDGDPKARNKARNPCRLLGLARVPRTRLTTETASLR